MKKSNKYIYEELYSEAVIILRNITSLIYLIKLFVDSTILWLPIGLSLVFNLLINNGRKSNIISEKNRISTSYNKSNLSAFCAIVFINILIIITSVLGLNYIIDILDKSNTSLSVMPRLILSIIFIGSGLGLMQQMLTLKK